MSEPAFLDLAPSPPEEADVLLLPLPYEQSVSYGGGTVNGPRAIWAASTQVELWDEELDFDLESLKFHSAEPVMRVEQESAEDYLDRVRQTAARLQQYQGLVIGVGGEHSLTPALVSACFPESTEPDLSDLTIVQFDAHADLRAEYEGSACSHACAMRPLVDRGANVICIGLRSADREEYEYGKSSGRVQSYFSQQLATEPESEKRLLETLRTLSGKVYLTFDIDALEVHYCPGTGTPQPGGLMWWPTMRYLKTLLRENSSRELLGCDLVETAPLPHTHVNEFTAAKLLTKMIGYYLA